MLELRFASCEHPDAFISASITQTALRIRVYLFVLGARSDPIPIAAGLT